MLMFHPLSNANVRLCQRARVPSPFLTFVCANVRVFPSPFLTFACANVRVFPSPFLTFACANVRVFRHLKSLTCSAAPTSLATLCLTWLVA